MTKEQEFTEASIPGTLLKFIVPSVMGQLVFLVLNLTDTFFVGRTGDTSQIAAMTITFPLIMMTQFISSVFGVGANANIAAELGRSDRKRAMNFSSFAIYTGILTVVLYSILLACFETPILTLLGADQYSIKYSAAYIFWVLHVGCIPAVLIQIFSQLFMAEGETKTAAAGVSIAGIINIILDPICIFTLHMGVAGAAFATMIGNVTGVVYDLVMLRKRKDQTVISLLPSSYKAGDGICRKTLAIGVPAGLVFLFNCICDFTRNALLAKEGSQAVLAAWGVVQKIGNAFMQICVGIAQGIRSVLSYNYSAGNFKRAKNIISSTLIVMLVYTCGSVLLVRLIPNQLVHIFLQSGDSADIAAVYLSRWIFCVIGIGLVEVYNTVFQAFGSWKLAMANTVINRGLMLTPVMILLNHLFGIDGMLISQPITEITTAAVLTLVYMLTIRKRLIKTEESK